MSKASQADKILYCCSRCKQRVRVYIPATVICSRCGRKMRAGEDNDGDDS